MAILPIVKDPDPVLRKKAKPVTKISGTIKQLLDDMAQTMYDAPGVGLAAPQVGVSKRIVVFDPGEEGWDLVELINPEIIAKEEWGVVGIEGCLSIPGMIGDVPRYRKIKVTALDRHGRQFWLEAEDWVARVIQHEVDHLDGIMYTDTCTNYRPTPKPEEAEEGEAGSEERAVRRRVKVRRAITKESAATESSAADQPAEE